MNTTFKKSLVALALTSAAMTAQAVDLQVNTTAVTRSYEGSVTQADIALNNVVARVGSGIEYAVGDLITISVSGGEILPSASSPVLTFTAAQDEDAGTGGIQNDDSVTFTLLSKDATSVTFRVATITEGAGNGGDDAGVTTGGSFALTGIKLKTTSVLASSSNKVTVTYSAKTAQSGLTIDAADSTGKDKVEAIVVRSQFGASVTRKANAVIDVSQDRQLFVKQITPEALPDQDTDNKDTLVFAWANNSGDTDASPVNAGAGALKFEIEGDFSWLDANKNGTITAGEIAAGAAYVPSTGGDIVGAADTAALTLSSDFKTLTLSVTPNATNAFDAKHGVTFTAPGKDAAKPVLVASAFKVNTIVAHTPAGGTSTATAAKSGDDAGAWTLNGSSIVVPYMVVQYGKFSNILNVHNSGAKEGAIAVDLWAEDGTVLKTNLPAGSSKPGSIVSVVKPILDELEKTKNLNTQTKYSVRIVTNVPAKDVTVNSAYADVSGTTTTRTPVANDSSVQNKGNL